MKFKLGMLVLLAYLLCCACAVTTKPEITAPSKVSTPPPTYTPFPTFTPVSDSAGPGLAEGQYVLAKTDIILLWKNATLRFEELLRQAKEEDPTLLLDTQWKGELGDCALKLKQGGATLRGLSAPEGFQQYHGELLELANQQDELADAQLRWLEDVFDSDLLSAMTNQTGETLQLMKQIVEGKEESTVPTPSPAAIESRPSPTLMPPSEVITYTVRAGDALSEIAAEFGVTVDAIAEANDIEDPSLIRVGQVLVIPSPGPRE